MTPDHPNTPALSEEEWAKAHGSLYADAGYTMHWGADVFNHEDDSGSIRIPSDGSRLHALAALCLHQQPFGFSQADVDACRVAEFWTGIGGPVETIERLRSLASRLSNLLPKP